MAHTHFTRDDRIFLAKLMRGGLSVRAIARILDFHPSSVYRELKRGRVPKLGKTGIGYSIAKAQKHKKDARRKANQQHRKLGAAQATMLLNLIRQYYSPDQAGQAIGLSHSTVYRWLWSLPKNILQGLWRYLRHPRLRRRYGTKRRERQRKLAKKRWIDSRPEAANQRLMYGHWEGDTVRGKGNSGHLVTLVERKSGYALVGFIPKATKEAFCQEALRLLSPLPKHLKRSITLDNGTEMNHYEVLERRSGALVYFAHPYHSWERGCNENFNGLLRQFFPRQMSFENITRKQVDLAANLLNTRPRKRHGYKSPKEILQPYLDVAI